MAWPPLAPADAAMACERSVGFKRVCLAELDAAEVEQHALAKRSRFVGENKYTAACSQPRAGPRRWDACAGCGGWGVVRAHDGTTKTCPLCVGNGWYLSTLPL